MSLLNIENLSLAIHGTPILKGISLQIAEGEITALTGESGSGKSMTAFATMGLLPKGTTTSGAVTFDGINLLTLSEPQMCDLRGREIGMVFQEPMTALNPVQTIGAQVMETILIHKAMPPEKAEERARDVLARVGLPPDRFPLSRYPHELSGGQRQRVVIAMAIALRPRLLIADEPTTALDVTTQAQILDLLKRLVREDGMALMMITHDLAVVSDMADTLNVMRNGEIVEAGPTAEVLREMRHPYTRALFEASRHQADLGDAKADAPLLSVRNVSRDYPLPRSSLFGTRPMFRAVKNVSFEIRRGERVGLVGESGCGKSTLTRAILGLEPVQAGQITLDGDPVWQDGHPNLTVRRKMQVVFQDPYGSFNPRHRVSRLITEPFHLLPDPPRGAARDAAIAEALTAVGLKPEDAERHIHAFSGGQRQRIAIARALIIKPDLIVFDEAVSALDVRVRAQILDLMADLSRAYGLTYLFISHDLSVVRSITDRVMVMRAGEIVEDRPTADIFAAPDHPYTRELMDAAPHLPDFPEAQDAPQPAL
jgi:peptide/nickel transport system ATP-binding protein